jgi:hypothetical protein
MRGCITNLSARSRNRKAEARIPEIRRKSEIQDAGAIANGLRVRGASSTAAVLPHLYPGKWGLDL